MPLTPEQRSAISLRNIEQMDCGVIALQAVTQLSRDRCLAAACVNGYDPDTGTVRGGLERSLQSLGYKTIVMGYPSPPETPATFSLMNEEGKFLIYVEAHVMALVAGDLHNAIGYYAHPIDQITVVCEPGVPLPLGG